MPPSIVHYWPDQNIRLVGMSYMRYLRIGLPGIMIALPGLDRDASHEEDAQAPTLVPARRDRESQ
jgi:hypothetical protein